MSRWPAPRVTEVGTESRPKHAIQILDERLISQIAAGEVVERPASVVKELVENALDAGASTIRVELEEGGKRRIKVVDDGRGMGSEDALLAFDRHATSKISSFEDLQRVGTLGFRGEALSSIASVARVTLQTATDPGDGHRVRIDGGRVRATEPVAHARGTSVEVESLFYNVPARREFLKAGRTELRRATEVVQGYALSRPEVGFSLYHETRLLLKAVPAVAGSAGARDRISQVFGGDLVDHLIDLPPSAEGETSIWGLVGDPRTVRGRRYFTFVNRRLLRDRALMATFYRSVREAWRSEEFPALFLFVDLAAEAVDVNVHPQKSEVRFRDPAIFGRIEAALRTALGEALGEGRAPLRMPLAEPSVPFVWQGVGRKGFANFEVREGQRPGAEGGELADVVYAPLRPRTVPLSGRSGEPRRFQILGQYKGSLILLEGPEGLLLIDQHAAHERILYERLQRASRDERIVAQEFVAPVMLELGASESLMLGEVQPQLEQCGFSLTELSSNSWALRSAPATLTPDEAEGVVLAMSTDTELRQGNVDIRERLLHALSASQSCRSAIKIHHPLTPEEMEALVEELFAAELPYTCPHGRPVVLEMSDADLERRFGRR